MGKIEDLLQEHQSQAVIFNGCQENGTCVSANSGMLRQVLLRAT